MTPRLPDLLDGLVIVPGSLLGPASRSCSDRDGGALSREPPTDLGPNAAAGASHDRHLVLHSTTRVRTVHAMETEELMPGAYRAEMGRLLDVPNRIQGELLTVPVHGDWTVKEVLVHLTGWDRAVAASADDVLAGRPGRPTRMSLEDIHQKVVDSWRRATLDDARWELAEAHHAVLDRLDGFSLEQ